MVRSSSHRTATCCLALLTLVALFSCSGMACGGSSPSTPAATRHPTFAASSPPPGTADVPHRPNIVLILTDDQDAASMAAMPNVQSLLVKRGTTLANFFVTVSLCCPSRATILRGQYAHNHGVLTNQPPTGGFDQFRFAGDEESTIATWLQAAGYRTALFGKYLNGYPSSSSATYVPPGWNEWFATFGPNVYSEFSYQANDNGKVVSYGAEPDDYGVDVIARKATGFIASAPTRVPFFLYIAPYAPHAPAAPAPRHAQLFSSASAPRPASFNEPDVSDKPAYIRNYAPLSPGQQTQIDADYRERLRSLQSVDDLVDEVVKALEQTGQLDNTYIFFTSDNGFMQGQHRLPQGKEVPYDESIRVSLVVRGPGISPDATLDALSGNTDLAPTFAAIAGAPAPDFVDGRSLLPLLSSGRAEPGRKALLVEHWPGPGGLGSIQRLPQFHGVRLQGMTYVEYATGERELYDLEMDPQELQNVAGAADPALIARLAALLARLKTCAAEECRSAEDAGP